MNEDQAVIADRLFEGRPWKRQDPANTDERDDQPSKIPVLGEFHSDEPELPPNIILGYN